MKKFYDDNSKHIALVMELMYVVAEELDKRAPEHDKSKTEVEEEYEGFCDIARGERSEKFFKAKELHYKNNRHHPEHYDNGIKGMNIIDLTEMICDWISSRECRDGIKYDRLAVEQACEQHGIEGQLVDIIANTVEMLYGEEVKKEKKEAGFFSAGVVWKETVA